MVCTHPFKIISEWHIAKFYLLHVFQFHRGIGRGAWQSCRGRQKCFNMSNVYHTTSPSPPLPSSTLAWCRDGMVPRERDSHMYVCVKMCDTHTFSYDSIDVGLAVVISALCTHRQKSVYTH